VRRARSAAPAERTRFGSGIRKLVRFIVTSHPWVRGTRLTKISEDASAVHPQRPGTGRAPTRGRPRPSVHCRLRKTSRTASTLRPVTCATR